MVKKNLAKGLVKKVITVAIAAFLSMSTLMAGTTTVFADENTSQNPDGNDDDLNNTPDSNKDDEDPGNEDPNNENSEEKDWYLAHYYVRYEKYDRPDENVNDPVVNYTGNMHSGRIKIEKSVEDPMGELKFEDKLNDTNSTKLEIQLADGTTNVVPLYTGNMDDITKNSVVDTLLDDDDQPSIDDCLKEMGYTQEQIDKWGLTINWYRTMYYAAEKDNGENYYHVDGEVIATKSGKEKEEEKKEEKKEDNVTPVTPNPTPTPIPDPTPDPTPNPDPIQVEIEDEDTPLVDTPVDEEEQVEIEDEDTPLADTPDLEEDEDTVEITDEDTPLADTVEIDEEDVPLSDNPLTGDSLPFVWGGLAVLAASGLFLAEKKKKMD